MSSVFLNPSKPEGRIFPLDLERCAHHNSQRRKTVSLWKAQLCLVACKQELNPAVRRYFGTEKATQTPKSGGKVLGLSPLKLCAALPTCLLPLVRKPRPTDWAVRLLLQAHLERNLCLVPPRHRQGCDQLPPQLFSPGTFPNHCLYPACRAALYFVSFIINHLFIKWDPKTLRDHKTLRVSTLI